MPARARRGLQKPGGSKSPVASPCSPWVLASGAELTVDAGGDTITEDILALMAAPSSDGMLVVSKGVLDCTSRAHTISRPVKLLNCRVRIHPGLTGLFCESRDCKVEAEGCLFETVPEEAGRGSRARPRLRTDPDKSLGVCVLQGGSFSARSCVFQGSASAVLVKDGSAVLQRCLFKAVGTIRHAWPYLQV